MTAKKMPVTITMMMLSLVLLAGCSSRLHTRVMSEGVPSTPQEVVQSEGSDLASEEIGSGPPDVVATEQKAEGFSESDISVEAPPVPTFHESQPVQPIFAAPQESAGLPSSLSATQSNPMERPNEMEMIQEPLSQEFPLEIAKLDPREPKAVPQEQRTEELLKTLEDVYFDYDRFGLRKEAYPELVSNAELLSRQLSDRTILLEGHCDERGTESYNMILGKRRALAVKDYLVDLGVPGEKLQVVSFGKEKPFCTEQTRECWQENRRVHFAVK